ncbi:MAG TPA: PEP-CTERM sorting domain-containing protein [Phycisphaerae bacterium]|nr:PEP-CTERM sorting domain-containing protein [Phycisphaerae bacterium]
MKKNALSLALAIAAVSFITGVSQASVFTLTSSRTTTVIPSTASVIGGGATHGMQVDVVTFKIQNVTGGTDTTLTGINLDATTPGTSTATAMIFQTYDAYGDGGTSINLAANPNIVFGSANGSYIRYGSATTFALVSASPAYSQDPTNSGGTTFDPTQNFVDNHDFNVQGGVLGGAADTTAINLASIVVPVGTPVTLAGYASGAAGAAVPVSITNGAVVPEPASLGVLALGGAALLARRKKA